MDYKKYVGQYVKRFYTPFEEENIFKISDYREVIYYDKNDETGKPQKPKAEFCYVQLNNPHQESWRDVEDSVIITNEEPMVEDERLANTNHPRYLGYNPFTKQII